MRLLVTGGAGFIGSNLVDGLIETGHDVTILDNLSSGKKENISSQAVFRQGDIKDTTVLERIFEDDRPQAVIHLAAQKSVAHSVEAPIFDAQENIIGSLTLLETMRKHGVTKIVFTSTGGALYGEASTLPTPETQMALPESPYAIAKLSVENYLGFYQQVHGFVPIILRLANVYGPRQDPKGEAGVVAIFCGLILQNNPVTIFGQGTRDYVFVRDVCEALRLAVEFPTGLKANIGTGIETTVDQIKAILAAQVKQPIQVNHQPKRPGELERSALDYSLAQEKLGWQPNVRLELGLSETFAWFQGQTKRRDQ